MDIAPCDARICGAIVKAFRPDDTEIEDFPHLGRAIISDMVAKSGGKYDDGAVWSPKRDVTVDGPLAHEGDTMVVKRVCRLSLQEIDLAPCPRSSMNKERYKI